MTTSKWSHVISHSSPWSHWTRVARRSQQQSNVANATCKRKKSHYVYPLVSSFSKYHIHATCLCSLALIAVSMDVLCKRSSYICIPKTSVCGIITSYLQVFPFICCELSLSTTQIHYVDTYTPTLSQIYGISQHKPPDCIYIYGKFNQKLWLSHDTHCYCKRLTEMHSGFK